MYTCISYLHTHIHIHTNTHTYIGIVDPPDNITTRIVCQNNVRRLQIELKKPSTLLGVEIINYNVVVEGMQEHETNGSNNKIIVDYPYINSSSCQNQSICVSATTLAGVSNFSCIEVFLIESKEMISLCMHSVMAHEIPLL